jgi:transcriptional regulator with XRE-family HTH domain
MPAHLSGTSYSKTIDPRWLAIGKRVATKRRELGLSQAALGAKIRTPHKPDGLTAGWVGQLETGMLKPEMENFDRLSTILGVTREWLLTGKESESDLAKALDARELALLQGFRRQSEEIKVAVTHWLQGGSGVPPRVAKPRKSRA